MLTLLCCLQVRSANGFGNIRLTCPEEHLDIIKWLGKFTSKVLKLAGTGNVQGLKQVYRARHSREFAPVVQLERRHFRPNLHPKDRPVKYRLHPRPACC